MNPLNRLAFEQSVAANPQLWKEAIQEYRDEARNADYQLNVMRGNGELNYNRPLAGRFLLDFRYDALSVEHSVFIVSNDRERLIQRLVLRVTKTRPENLIFYSQSQHVSITNIESSKRIYDFLNYKLNYADQPQDNFTFETRRLSKLFAKITKDNPKIKGIEEKEADAKLKAIARLNALKRDLEQQLKDKLPRDRTIDRFETNVEELRTDPKRKIP